MWIDNVLHRYEFRRTVLRTMEECYRIMEEYSRNPEKFSVSEGVEENKDNDPVCIYVDNKNLKRKVWDSEKEPVVH